MLLHGAYDYIASNTSESGTVIFAGFVVVLFIASYVTVSRASEADKYI